MIIPTVDVLGYPVARTHLAEIVHWTYGRQEHQRPALLAVLNANKLWLAAHDPHLQRILLEADLLLPEYAITWAARQLGLPDTSPIYGVSFSMALLEQAARTGQRPFLLGATPEVSERLPAALAARYPGLVLAGVHHGYLGDPAVEQAALGSIAHSKADVLLVGMGSPRQEFWMDSHREALRVPVMVGVGGTLDILAGLKADTPAGVRGSGWEWLYRLIQDPRQYGGRYLVTNPWFVWQVWRARFLPRR